MRHPKTCAAIAAAGPAAPKAREVVEKVGSLVQRRPNVVNVAQRASCQASSAPTTNSVVQGGIVNADKVNTVSRVGQYVDDLAEATVVEVNAAQKALELYQRTTPVHLQPIQPAWTNAQLGTYVRQTTTEVVKWVTGPPGTKSRSFGRSNLRHK
jgi:hypothetical protein